MKKFRVWIGISLCRLASWIIPDAEILPAPSEQLITDNNVNGMKHNELLLPKVGGAVVKGYDRTN